MPALTRVFYLFSGIHSFLIGLLPIFIPVILWNRGFLLSDIAFFIATSAVGFVVALYVWDRLRENNKWVAILGLSFVFEVLLVILLLWQENAFLLTIGALINGAAGCFYWSHNVFYFNE